VLVALLHAEIVFGSDPEHMRASVAFLRLSDIQYLRTGEWFFPTYHSYTSSVSI
jgi:hypothetical protein